MSELRKIYNEIAEHFDETRYKTWDEVENFIKSLKTKEVSADLGCGNGRHTIPLANKTKKVYALDISEELLKITKEKIQDNKINNVEFIRSNITETPIEDNKIDSFIYIATLHHLKEGEREESLKEIKRITKNEYKGLISVWARDQPRFKDKTENGDAYVEWERKDGETFERYYHLFTMEELEKLVKKSGLKINKSFRSHDNLYVEVKEK